jgi:hypothetical protein
MYRMLSFRPLPLRKRENELDPAGAGSVVLTPAREIEAEKVIMLERPKDMETFSPPQADLFASGELRLGNFFRKVTNATKNSILQDPVNPVEKFVFALPHASLPNGFSLYCSSKR